MNPTRAMLAQAIAAALSAVVLCAFTEKWQFVFAMLAFILVGVAARFSGVGLPSSRPAAALVPNAIGETAETKGAWQVLRADPDRLAPRQLQVVARSEVLGVAGVLVLALVLAWPFDVLPLVGSSEPGSWVVAASTIPLMAAFLSSLADHFLILPWRDRATPEQKKSGVRLVRFWYSHRLATALLFFAGYWGVLPAAVFLAVEDVSPAAAGVLGVLSVLAVLAYVVKHFFASYLAEVPAAAWLTMRGTVTLGMWLEVAIEGGGELKGTVYEVSVEGVGLEGVEVTGDHAVGATKALVRNRVVKTTLSSRG